MALPHNPLEKPQKRTPEERRAERKSRERNPFKPRFGEQDRVVAPDPLDHDRYKVDGSSLHSFSRKRLQEAKDGKRKLSSTFTPKPGRRFLSHQRCIQTHIIRSVRTTGYTLKRGKALNLEGVRGRRMKPGDRKQEAASHILPCTCGCNAHLRPGADGIPGKGLISRAHLESRRFESTRNEDFNNLPSCLDLNHWLDHEVQGEKARAELLALARELGRRLTHQDVYPLLTRNGYYATLAERRTMER